ncbi:MAG: hypothetical protein ABSG46_20575 [Candidatus Binataceae bacterium]|jgi:hypothetical protein
MARHAREEVLAEIVEADKHEALLIDTMSAQDVAEVLFGLFGEATLDDVGVFLRTRNDAEFAIRSIRPILPNEDIMDGNTGAE